MNEEQKDQQLDAAYRRASASQAGRPDAKTRAAILAEAAAAARRRTPAANDSRYLMRALAGIAVVGVGLLVWRQTDHRLPGEAPSLDVPVAQPSAELAQDSAFAPAGEEPRPPDAGQELPSLRVARDAAPAAAEKSEAPAESSATPTVRDSRPEPPAAAQAPVQSTSPPPPPPASVRAQAGNESESDELQEVQVTGSRVVRERRTVGPRGTVPAAGGAPTPAPQAALRIDPTPEELLREHFPAQFQSGTPRRLWLVRDADGAVWSTGELGPREQLADQLSSIKRSLDAIDLAVESVQSVPNARGQLIELTLLRAR